MLKRFLEPKSEFAWTFLRTVSGLMFAFHGLQGLTGVLGGFRMPVGSQGWIGSLIELVTGAAIAVGLLTTWAAFLASGTMAVAYLQFHWRFAGGARFLPAVNQGEPALLYAALFLFIACRGSGRFSLDRLRPRAA